MSSKEVIAKLTEMGFENSNVLEAVKVVGPSVDDAVEYMLKGCGRDSHMETSSSTKPGIFVKSLGQKRQSSILEHFKSINRTNRVVTGVVEQKKEPHSGESYCVETSPDTFPVHCSDREEIRPDWEQKVHSLLQKRFGYFSLKSFQREALSSWLARQDCLVLAATGSGNFYVYVCFCFLAVLFGGWQVLMLNYLLAGKSLCFQLPALLTGKVVVVISPLISLMHDQCLKLANYGVSACFLGSGQPDSTVEKKAMTGMYSIIYVCPETVLR